MNEGEKGPALGRNRTHYFSVTRHALLRCAATDVILDQNYDTTLDFLGLDCDVLRLRPSPGPRSEPTVVLVGQAPVHHARQAPLLSQDLQASGEPWSFFRPPNLNSSR